MQPETISPNYTLAFEFLHEWVPKLNSTFEPYENGSVEALSDEMMLAHPTLLALADDFLTIEWSKEYPFASITLKEIAALV